MSSQRNLISKILHERDLAPIVDAGVTPNFFPTADHRLAFETILEHQTKYGVVPTIESFHRDWPTYKVAEAGDSIQYYVDQVVYEYSLALLEDGLVEATDFYDNNDPEASKNALGKLVNTLNQEVSGSRSVDLTETSDQRLERYRLYAKNQGRLKGITTGIPSLDALTGGWQKQQFTTFVGPPGAGKSTLMLLAAIAAHSWYYRPLFIGFEMSNEEQEERHDAIRSVISHKRLREGRLTPEEFQRLERMTRRLELMPPFTFCEDASAASTLSGVASQIDRYNPDIVFVDGMYMMDDEEGQPKGSPQALTNITRGFKQMMRGRKIPGIGSTQVLLQKMDRKKGVTQASIGYSSSFLQDSDHVVSVEPTDIDTINKFKVLKGRNNAKMETYLQWNWETGEFTELEDYDPSEDEEGNPRF